ncbi:MAG: hypothetical protein FJ123_13785 [Deltaproteobacteria bacterium]|nr:hypothetical protein [Deltaproteobacteria bacterium]
MNEKLLSRAVNAIERIGVILGAIYSSQLEELDQGRKAERLQRCGFSNKDIATILCTTSNTINVALHKERRKKVKEGASKNKKVQK